LSYNTYIHGKATRKLSVTILNKQKYLFCKNREQKGNKGTVWEMVGGEGKEIRKGWRLNVMEILCTHA
jgi:hypothetical protein